MAASADEIPLRDDDVAQVARDASVSHAQVRSVVSLADEGNTVPFITRYRKERTGNLDEQKIRDILERISACRQLRERATTILRGIESQGKLTPALQAAIEAADSLKRLEDLYLPFKPRKRTRAAIARERGLEPLAEAIWSRHVAGSQLQTEAGRYVSAERGVADAAGALAGAADLIAERVSEIPDVREIARRHVAQRGTVSAVAANSSDPKAADFQDYFDFNEPLGKLPPHRILALNRGESSGILRVKLEWDEPAVVSDMSRALRFANHPCEEFLQDCLTDSVRRLIHPSIERESRRDLTEKAEAHAIGVFAQNLRQLLLQPPVAGRPLLAVDPGFRTGCKVVVLDGTGKLIASDVVYVTGSDDKRAASQQRLFDLAKQHKVSLIAIGNGTACRETEELVAEMIAAHDASLRYVIVNEAGASIYSASDAARDEFPDLDATVRGTISIGRRLQDPLSELVKIEPQHLGVGMYQHDVDAKRLKETLDTVIESCVNFVGVDLNTASASLLRHVSGLNQLTARRIVEFREQHGPFRQRKQLREVTGVGEGTFHQAAGFLRVREGDEPLDDTWIHPESYPVTRALLAELAPQGWESGSQLAPVLREKLTGVSTAELAGRLNVGEPTLRDILEALTRPGLDPRAELPGPLFKGGIVKLDDLSPGTELRGRVQNVVDFGAFVDVGLKESGLVHISQMASRFIKSPHEVVRVGDIVTVWVLQVDVARKRVSLTMRPPATASATVSAPSGGNASASPANPPTTASQPVTSQPRTNNPPVSPASETTAGVLRSFQDLRNTWNKPNGDA